MTPEEREPFWGDVLINVRVHTWWSFSCFSLRRLGRSDDDARLNYLYTKREEKGTAL